MFGAKTGYLALPKLMIIWPKWSKFQSRVLRFLILFFGMESVALSVFPLYCLDGFESVFSELDVVGCNLFRSFSWLCSSDLYAPHSSFFLRVEMPLLLVCVCVLFKI